MAALVAKGNNGVVTVDGDWLTIERRTPGRAGHSLGFRRIALASITAVQLQPAGVFANGLIRFTVSDSPQSRGGVQNAIADENAIIFRRRQARGFNIVRAAVQDYIATHRAGGAGGAGEPDIPEQLEKLGELHDQKLITDEEFEAKKAQLLDRL